MFLFSCCTGSGSKQVYEIRTSFKNQMSSKYCNEISADEHKNMKAHMQVLKVSKSDYDELITSYVDSKEQWIDISFPPNSQSFGHIEQIKFHQWKRISQIIRYPVLFDGRIQPSDVIQGDLGDCYFLSAVAALAQKESRIKNVFGNQQYNFNGIYKVTLRINGTIQEIVVDDFIPVNKQGVPLFCQPNKNQFWIPILEKAWAKANGSYANIVAGSPTEFFKAATYAPAEMISTKDSKEENVKLWRIILQNTKKDRPCCCGTSESEDINWYNAKLIAGHAYSLIDAVELEDRKGNIQRVLKIRNPWGNTEWQGQACQKDLAFWNLIVDNEQKRQFLKDNLISNDGIFSMTFNDYVKYFAQTHISYMEETGNYISQNYFPNAKHGSFWSLQILEEDSYAIELHQTGGRLHQQSQDSLARATILVFRNTETSYQFINGTLRYYEEDASLQVRLLPGKYTIFTKFDSLFKKMPQTCSVSIYSLHFAALTLLDRTLCDKVLNDGFLFHARQVKRQKFNNGTMWMSWKLLFKEGGYAYLAFGNDKTSKHKFTVTFNQSDFVKNNFKLKKPYNKKGDNQTFSVLPGQQKMLLTRVVNGNIKNFKFPPLFNWKIQEHS